MSHGVGLQSWRGVADDLGGAVERVAGHPRFAEAVRALAAGMLDLAARNPVLNEIFKDAGRYFAAMWAFALHEESGLTLPGLKAVGVQSGFLSPGRARALLQFLEHYAYLERRPGPRRGLVYVPTASFMAAWDQQFLAALEAASLVEPDVADFLAPEAVDARLAYGRIHAHGLQGMSGDGMKVMSWLRVFLHPYAGNHIVWTLIGRSLGPEFPPLRAGPISIAGLARDCGTSRMQVARIFNEAKAEGLATLDADNMVRFHAPAREQLRVLYAVQLAQILAAAARSVPALAPPA